MAGADFGLPSHAVQALCDTLAQHAHVQRAIVYGSRAKGNYRPGSDIDLTLEGSQLTFPEMLQIASELDEQMLPYKIDLSLRAHIDNPALCEHIARVGKVLWQNPAPTPENRAH